MNHLTRPLAPAWFCNIFKAQIFWTLLIIILSSSIYFLSPLDRNYTSGELLDQLKAFQEGAIYTPLSQAPYLVFNYPPLFHGLTSWLSALGLSLLSAGRLLNLFSFFACILVVYHWLRRSGLTRFHTLATLSFIGTSYPLLTSLGQIQLQMTAVFFSLSGLFVLNFSKNRGQVFLAGMLLALACLTKQTQVLTALTALSWCFWYQRKSAAILFLTLLGTGLLGLALLHFVYGYEIWQHLLKYTVGSFSLFNLSKQLLSHLIPWLPLIILSGYGTRSLQNKKQDLIWWYVITSALSLITSARLGSSAMYFVEFSWALLLTLGLVLPNILRLQSYFLRILLILQIVLGNLSIVAVLAYDADQVLKQGQIAQKLCDKLPQTNTLLIASHPGLLQACGHRMAFYPFITSSLMRKNLWEAKPLLQNIEQGNFPAVLLEFPVEAKLSIVDQERWHPKLLRGIQLNYVLKSQVDNYYLYQPKHVR